jgi:hypothetical protein
VAAGLDFDVAQSDPDLPKISSSPQIVIQLSRFNKQVCTKFIALHSA